MGARDAIRYHYTIGYWARLIIDEGEIRPATTHIGQNEKPVVWFSTNPTWEGSANKVADGEGMKASAEAGGGICRFAVAPETAPHDWEAFVRLSGIKPDTARLLKRAARKMGANTRQFFVAFDAVKRDQWLSVEVFDFDYARWVPADLDKLPHAANARELKRLQGGWAPQSEDATA